VLNLKSPPEGMIIIWGWMKRQPGVAPIEPDSPLGFRLGPVDGDTSRSRPAQKTPGYVCTPKTRPQSLTPTTWLQKRAKTLPDDPQLSELLGRLSYEKKGIPPGHPVIP